MHEDGGAEANKRGEDAGMFAAQGTLLVDAVTAAGHPPTVVRMPDTDHIRSGAAFGDAVFDGL